MCQARHGSKHHQSAIYAIYLRIMLVRAQSVKELIYIYIIIINKFVIEKNAFLSSISLLTRRDAPQTYSR